MMVAANGFFATFMVDGFFRGRWELKRERKAPVRLSVLPFATPLTKQEAVEYGRMLVSAAATLSDGLSRPKLTAAEGQS